MHSNITLSLFLFLLSLAHSANAQQSYAPSSCHNSTSALGYACNGAKSLCSTYLIYRAQPPYNNASSIATLFASSASSIATLNNVSQSTTLVTRQEIIVPVNCSCSGAHYQSNTTYVVVTDDNPSRIANGSFEGLTTCLAIQSQRSGLVVDIFPREKLTIPVRCACPTANQSRSGIKYLMTYVIKSGDTISTAALRFGGDVGETLVANEKSVQDFIIQPFTTLLIPLRDPPNSSMTETPVMVPAPLPSPSPASSVSDSSHPESKQKWNFFVYGVVAGAGIALTVAFCGIYLLRRRKTEVSTEVKKSEVEDDIKPLELLENISRVAQSLKVLSFKELQSATDNFSSTSKISGSVYLGEIGLDKQKVAIKQTEADVSREIEILNKINHANIISLIGVCYNNGLWYLIYQFAANGRLSDRIFGSPALTWEQRIQILLDVATGLDYLHGYTSPPYIHKDLSSSHVLLDSNFRAKISHFGLSKSIESDKFALTHHIVGTQGYMAPEYLEHGLVTTKMDVYAFGIMVVEILSGKEAGSLSLSEVLAPLVVDDAEEDKLRGFMDMNLMGKYPLDVAMVLVKLAERCVRKEMSERPGMDDVVSLLSKSVTSSAVWGSSTASTFSSQTTANSGH